MEGGKSGAEMEMRWEDTAPILKSLMDLYDAHTEDAELCTKAKGLSKEIEGLYDDAGRDVRSSIRALTSDVSTRLSKENVTPSREEAEEIIPRLRHSISLFASITNIRWDASAPRRVKGEVLPPDGTAPRPFDFDPATMPAVDITNALWDLISETSD